MRVVDYLVRALSRYGIQHIFGVGGANIEDLYDAIFHLHGPIRGIVAKHEFSAATMADGYVRASNQLAVVAATSGGAAMNLVAGLAEAEASRVPVLALVGQPPLCIQGRGAFQDGSGRNGAIDAQRLFATVSRFCSRVTDPHSIVDLLPAAIAAARANPQGPAVLLIPKDVQQALFDPPPITLTPGALSATVPIDPDNAAALDRAVAVLRSAMGSVLIIAGEGVARSGARTELNRLAESLGAWVAVTPDAKDVFNNHDSRFAGVTGVMGHPNVIDCMHRASVCLLVGTRLPLIARDGLESALADTTLVCIDPEPPFISGRAVLSLRGELRDQLGRLLEHLIRPVQTCPPHVGAVPLPLQSLNDALGLPEAVAAIGEALPTSANVFVDAGNAGASAIHLLPSPQDGRFVVAMGMGGMGYTFGAGIGAALATGKRTYVLAGDGAFYMHGLELHTAIEYDVPVTFVIFNNNAHAMCATREKLFYDDAYSYNLFGPADIAAGVGAMFPALATTRVDSAQALREALIRTNLSGLPALVCVDIDPREIPPFVPFLAAADAGTHKEVLAYEH